MADIADLLQKREKKLTRMRQVREDYEEEEGGESWQEYKKNRRYDELADELKDLNVQIQDTRQEREERRRDLGGGDDPEPRGGRDAPDGDEESADLPPLFGSRDLHDLEPEKRQVARAYRGYARHLQEERGLDPVAYRDAFRAHISRDRGQQLGAEEHRDLKAGSDPEGGYTVPPNFAATLLQKLDNEVVIRQFADVVPVNTGDSLGVPTLETDPSDPVWTTEVQTGDEDTSMDFGDRELHPHPLAKRIKVSRKLIRASAIGVESTVRDRLGYKFGVAQEKGFMTGSGSQQPLGLFTADSSGISTTRDVNTNANTTSTTFDHLKAVKWELKSGYRENARWIAHRDFGEQVDTLKDGEGQYIWQTSTQADEPDMLLGHPVTFSEYAPNTFTSGNYVALFGDLSYYRIADALNLTIQRLAELYAEENKIGFIGRLEADGMPVFEEAFVRATLA